MEYHQTSCKLIDNCPHGKSVDIGCYSTHLPIRGCFISRLDSDKKCTSKKFDAEKIRWDLIPIETIEEIAKVYNYGAIKYGPNQWQKLSDFEDRYYAALLRHLCAWRKGENIDEESGLRHIAQVAWNALALLWKELHE